MIFDNDGDALKAFFPFFSDQFPIEKPKTNQEAKAKKRKPNEKSK